MATVCDACSAKFKHEDGYGTLHVSAPMPTREERLKHGPSAFDFRELVNLDLCASCTVKALAAVGLSTELCEPPKPISPTKEPPKGLGAEDLLQLHAKGDLTVADLEALGVKPPPSKA